MLMQSEKKTVQIQLQFIIILGFNAPGNCPILFGYLPTLPSTSPQSQPNARGREGGQVRVGSGLAKAVLVTREGSLQGGEARHKLGWVWEVASLRRDGLQLPVSVCAGPGPLLPTSTALPPDPAPSPETLLHGSYTNGHITK